MGRLCADAHPSTTLKAGWKPVLLGWELASWWQRPAPLTPLLSKRVQIRTGKVFGRHRHPKFDLRIER